MIRKIKLLNFVILVCLCLLIPKVAFSLSYDNEYSRTLWKGASGADVLAVQKRLKELGYFTVTPDGDFGKLTEAAVKGFQMANQIPADGGVGKWTWGVLFSEEAVGLRRTLWKGARGDDVLAVQKRLRELGYFTVTPDGDFGKLTEAAVKGFQMANQIPADGGVGKWTWGVLFSEEAVGLRRTLWKGARGDDVLAVQKRLRELGYFTVTPDGDFGKLTEAAVKGFQMANQIPADGGVGKWTWGVLFSEEAVGLRRTLWKGARGDDVLAAQRRLRDLGYFTAVPDGDFGNLTEAAVKGFQMKNQIPADGGVGKWTWGVLFSEEAVGLRRTLWKGARGDDVLAVQKRLKELGYFTVIPDGAFGKLTEKAVKGFQMANQIPADGGVGKWTWRVLFSEEAVGLRRTLWKGASGASVLAVQKRLSDLGYFTVTPDGDFGKLTEAAVKGFQMANQIPADGGVGKWTWGVLFSEEAVGLRRTLWKGARGDDVLAVQKRLSNLGFFTVVPDGDFGNLTEAAVKGFQMANQIPTDGGVGKWTWGVLFSEEAVGLRRTLWKGARGDDVLAVQKRLKELGYFTVTPDGDFGKLTEAAVKGFQQANGIFPDGGVGSKTWNKLFSEDVVALVSYYNTYYNYTFSDAVDIHMGRNPQTDLYGGGWKTAKREDVAYHLNPKSFLSFNPINDINNSQKLKITASILNVRSGPGTNYSILTTVSRNKIYTVLDVDHSTGWYKISANGFTGWISGTYAALIGNDQSMPISSISREMYQFLVLSGSSGISASNLISELRNKGILENMGQAFLDAGRNNNINEIYLLAHALLETGNGTSALATGITVTTVDGKSVTPRTVYNMYGIGAKDGDAIRLGSEFAYKQGWFTPEDAIIGGAKWIADEYINHPTHRQDTLYKMRWNPANPGIHQYATDIGWALKQTRNIELMLEICLRNSVPLRFDLPTYK